MSGSTRRTKEELDKYYQEYLNGSTLVELSNKYNTDAGYQFKTYGYKRIPKESTKKLRQLLGIQKYAIHYNYKFELISNEIEAYIVGFMYADGYAGRKQAGIKVQLQDLEILEKIKDYISTELNIYQSGNAVDFKISNQNVLDNIKSIGCVENKTYKRLVIPKMDSELYRHFIRGYFDGDGTVFRDGKYLKANLCSINIDFLEDLKQILLDNGIYSTINTEIREGKRCKTPQGFSDGCKNMHRLFIRKKEDFKKFYEFLYKESTIYLNRKYLKFDNGNTVLTS